MMRTVGLFALLASLVAAPMQTLSPKQGLEPFGVLVGSWRGTGTPAGTAAEQRAGFWQETLTVCWKFKKDDAAITFEFDKSKHFKSAQLHYVPKDERYRLKLETVAGKTLDLDGEFKNRTLTVEDASNRLIVTLLHDNRFLYRFDAKPAGKTLFSKQFQVGATKEGVAFAVGDGSPVCIVTGGSAKTPVSYMGTTYYVCCSGCRDEFLANPEKYIREAAEKKAKK
jgi:YHS domain-containing protein